MLSRISACILLLGIPGIVLAQFPPPVGYEGTTAMHKDSSAFIGWAGSCEVERGYINIADTSVYYLGSNKAQYGHYYFTNGIADGLVMSLGDGGVATLHFDTAIVNGPGFDFSVFENSFSDDFLELAFVEASSDGKRFVRFPSVSLTPTLTQIPTYGTLDTRKIHNLAGKYRGLYGTPFDLDDIRDSSGIDLNNILWVRIIDVVGCISDPYATFDSQGNRINDPWPTEFDTGGFDLDAIGVIHNRYTGFDRNESNQAVIFPNPVESSFRILVNQKVTAIRASLFDMTGREVTSFSNISEKPLEISYLEPGIYLLSLYFTNGSVSVHRIIRK